ncbi:hypothetical protein CPB86DRAFT_562477 [Serendipita vermifera]|nr:hypothetical protein CPB86DRAFT_562477 [Serendipita vermifera]
MSVEVRRPYPVHQLEGVAKKSQIKPSRCLIQLFTKLEHPHIRASPPTTATCPFQPSNNYPTAESMLSGDSITMKQKAIRDLISKREKEIESLEAKRMKLEQAADDDIYAQREREARQLRQLVDKIKKIKKDTEQFVKTRTTKLRQDKEPLNQKIVKLSRANQLSRASIAGIAKTPNEILSLIFREYIEMDYSVWDLVLVSEQWKQVAFATPHLWSAVTIRDNSIYFREQEFKHNRTVNRYSGRRHVCSEPTQLNTILDRCGTVFLDVSIKCATWRHNNMEDMIACLNVINSPDISRRISSLELDGYSSGLMDSLPECFMALPLPNLQHLALTSQLSDKWRSNLFHSISDSAIRLQTLHTGTKLVTTEISDRIWLGIKSLQLCSSFSTADFDKFVDKVTQLEELSNLPYSWPSSATPRSTFPNLMKIKLACSPQSSRRLYLPALQDLHVSDTRSYEHQLDCPSDLAAYPSLTSMSIESYRPDQCLAGISASELATLDLTIRSSQRTSASIDFRNTSIETFAALRTLKLASEAADSVTIAVLEGLIHLTSVTISNLSRDQSFGLALLPRLAEYDGNFSCTPNLKELLLGTPDRGRVHTRRGPLAPLIKRLITSRKKNNAPLATLGVFWRDSDNYQHYIK